MDNEPTLRRPSRKLAVPDIRLWIETGDVPKADDIGMFDMFDPRYSLSISDLDGYLDRFRMRDETIREFGFAIPCAEAMDAIAAFSPVLEVGAGTGYWSAILKKRGVDVIASDIGDNAYTFSTGSVMPVEIIDALSAVRKWPDRNVLMVWPTYEDSWAAQCAQAMRPGRVLALVSEGHGGCVADDALFDTLDRQFEHEQTVMIPVWEGMHDQLTIHRKR